MGRVAIVGGGMAGSSAAIAVAESGAEVVVLEATDELGGSAAISRGLIWGPRDLAAAHDHIPRGDAALRCSRAAASTWPRSWSAAGSPPNRRRW